MGRFLVLFLPNRPHERMIDNIRLSVLGMEIGNVDLEMPQPSPLLVFGLRSILQKEERIRQTGGRGGRLMFRNLFPLATITAVVVLMLTGCTPEATLLISQFPREGYTFVTAE